MWRLVRRTKYEIRINVFIEAQTRIEILKTDHYVNDRISFQLLVVYIYCLLSLRLEKIRFGLAVAASYAVIFLPLQLDCD
jgi:hypothetical protein